MSRKTTKQLLRDQCCKNCSSVRMIELDKPMPQVGICAFLVKPVSSEDTCDHWTKR